MNTPVTEEGLSWKSRWELMLKNESNVELGN